MSNVNRNDRNLQFTDAVHVSRKSKNFIIHSAFVVVGLYFILKCYLLVRVTFTVDDTSSNYVTESDGVRDNFLDAALSLKQQNFKLRQTTGIPGSNKECTSPFLGLPQSLVSRCQSNISLPSRLKTIDCSKLTCANLLSGHPFRRNNKALYQAAVDFFPNQREIQEREKEHGNQTASGRLSDLEILKQVSSTPSSCSEFKETYGFLDSVAAEAVDFPIAYNVLLHADAKQTVRLLRAIYRPNNVYCIHIDRKSPYHFRSAIEAVASCFENIKLVSNPVSVIYEGYSRLQADINCMKDLVGSKTNWKYLINTAGQAFPLRTVEETVRILKIYNGSNDVEGIYGKRVIRGRFEFEWIEDASSRKVRRSSRRNPPAPHGINVVRGSAYGVFTREFVEWALTNRYAIDLLKWSRWTYSPDEMYWATLHHAYANPRLQAPGSYQGYPSSKPWLAVYVNWAERGCEGRYVRAVCVFGVGDLPALSRRRELFANKFYEWFQPVAYDCLEQWIRHKEVCPPSDDFFDYYRQLPFVIR